MRQKKANTIFYVYIVLLHFFWSRFLTISAFYGSDSCIDFIIIARKIMTPTWYKWKYISEKERILFISDKKSIHFWPSNKQPYYLTFDLYPMANLKINEQNKIRSAFSVICKTKTKAVIIFSCILIWTLFLVSKQALIVYLHSNRSTKDLIIFRLIKSHKLFENSFKIILSSVNYLFSNLFFEIKG